MSRRSLSVDGNASSLTISRRHARAGQDEAVQPIRRGGGKSGAGSLLASPCRARNAMRCAQSCDARSTRSSATANPQDEHEPEPTAQLDEAPPQQCVTSRTVTRYSSAAWDAFAAAFAASSGLTTELCTAVCAHAAASVEAPGARNAKETANMSAATMRHKCWVCMTRPDIGSCPVDSEDT